MKSRFASFTGVLSATLLISTPAGAADKHDHGTGQLDVAIDKGRITLSLEIPLDALVGFERAPRNDRERQALAAAAASLKDGGALFQPSAAAACSLKAVNVSIPFSDAAAAKSAQASAEAHGDADASYEFECAQPIALKEIATTVFKSFPRLYRLEMQRIGPAGQGGGRLVPKSPFIRW